MKCKIINRINNIQICESEIIEFRGRTLTVSVDTDSIKVMTKCILTGELEDKSFRGEIEITKINNQTVTFKVSKSGIFDKRRYLRVALNKKAKIFIDGHDDIVTLTEIAYMSCRLGYCGRRLSDGEHVIVKISTGTDEIKIDGDVMQYCGSFGHGALESQMYIITFEGYNIGSIEGDLLYSYILRMAEYSG